MRALIVFALLLTACGPVAHSGPRATIGPTTPQPTVPAPAYPAPAQAVPFPACGEQRVVTDPLDGRVWVEVWVYEERDAEGNLIRTFCPDDPGAPTPQPPPGPTPPALTPTPEPVLTVRVVLSPVLRGAVP